jgi:eukaryotic-like serine/threonine-protein kinase
MGISADRCVVAAAIRQHVGGYCALRCDFAIMGRELLAGRGNKSQPSDVEVGYCAALIERNTVAPGVLDDAGTPLSTECRSLVSEVAQRREPRGSIFDQMSEDPQSQRPRTVTRMRAEAPPGMGLVSADGRQSIGRYEIIKTLGKGAMGIVYKARDPLLDRIVAVKTISSPQGAGRRVRAAFLERFQREAKAAAKMQHPAIVTIFDVGIDEESGAPYMVLEYLPGESMADRLDKVRFPLFRAVNASLELASALAFAHKQRIVHRDVKPANVLHAGENRWKLADFGIARMPDSDLTQVGIFMGTPGYSPPEAIREGRYTSQADVFAWGAVLYELVSGRIPYEGPDTKTTNSYVIAGNAHPPSKHDASIPEPIVKVIMTALEGHADRRYKDGGDVEAALREAWDRCLTQGLVSPSILTMDELAHDKAPALMHSGRGAPKPPPSVDLTTSETLEIASSRDGRFDDEQTTILKRDDLRPSAKMPPQERLSTAAAPRPVMDRAPAPPAPPQAPRESRPSGTQHGSGVPAPQKIPTPAPGSMMAAATHRDPTPPPALMSASTSKMPLWLVACLAIAVVAATVAILYLVGVIHFRS